MSYTPEAIIRVNHGSIAPTAAYAPESCTIRMPQGIDPSVRVTAELDVLHLTTPVAHTQHVLGARLDPANGATDAASDEPEQQLLRVHAGLRSEATTDVGRQHAYLVGGQAVLGGQLTAQRVRPLGRRPVHEASVDPRRGRGADLERTRCDPLIHHPLAHDDVASVEQRFVPTELELGRHVRTDLGKQQRVRFQRRLSVDEHGQRIEVDPDEVGCIGTLVFLLGDDGDDRLADEPHHVDGQQWPGHVLHERRQRREVDLARQDHVDHAGGSACLVHIDARDPRVGHR